MVSLCEVDPTLQSTIGGFVFRNFPVQRNALHTGWGMYSTYSLHCSSSLGIPFGILSIELVKPQKKKLQWRL